MREFFVLLKTAQVERVVFFECIVCVGDFCMTAVTEEFMQIFLSVDKTVHSRGIK